MVNFFSVCAVHSYKYILVPKKRQLIENVRKREVETVEK